VIRAVLDTNVIVSAHLQEEGHAALILELAMGKRFRCFASAPLFAEYEEVLRRPKFGLDEKRVTRSIRELRRNVGIVKASRELKVTKDPDDNVVLECALAARADYLVTGNLRDFPRQFQDIRVIGLKQFLMVLAAEPGLAW